MEYNKVHGNLFSMFLVSGGICGKWSIQKAVNRLSKAKITAFPHHMPSQKSTTAE